MNTKKVLTIVILIFLLVLAQFFPTKVYATHPPTEVEVAEALGQLTQVRFTPNEPLYPLISLKENVKRFFKPNAVTKAEFDLVLAGKRIKEAYLLTQKGKPQNCQATLEAYLEKLNQVREGFKKAKAQGQDVIEIVRLAQNNLPKQQALALALIYNFGDDAKNQFEDEVEKIEESLLETAKVFAQDQPDILIPFQEATKSATTD